MSVRLADVRVFGARKNATLFLSVTKCWTVGSNLRIDTRWAAGSADNIRKQRPNWLHTRRTLSWPVVARLWNNYCVLCT